MLPDGADFESSVPYHRLVTELFLGAARLAEHIGRPLPAALLGSSRDDGGLPRGRAPARWPDAAGRGCRRRSAAHPEWIWQPATAGSAASLRAGGVLVPHRPVGAHWWTKGPRGRPNGGDAIRPASELRASRTRPTPCGISRTRDSPSCDTRVDYLLVTNGIVGTRGFGNHKHNDLLGFEYHAHGGPVIVDPGSYVYTSDPDGRNLFRSTRSHNTISVDDEEQNECRPEWLFRMFEKAYPEHLEVVERDGWIEYRGRHSRLHASAATGRARADVQAAARRPGRSRFVDVLEGHGTHRLRWHFHFAPGVAVAMLGDGIVEIRTAGGVLQMTHSCRDCARPSGRPSIRRRTASGFHAWRSTWTRWIVSTAVASTRFRSCPDHDEVRGSHWALRRRRG